MNRAPTKHPHHKTSTPQNIHTTKYLHHKTSTAQHIYIKISLAQYNFNFLLHDNRNMRQTRKG